LPSCSTYHPNSTAKVCRIICQGLGVKRVLADTAEAGSLARQVAAAFQVSRQAAMIRLKTLQLLAIPGQAYISSKETSQFSYQKVSALIFLAPNYADSTINPTSKFCGWTPDGCSRL
jgi:hypothetical protein